MKMAYPVFIKQSGEYNLVYIPDFDGTTEGFGLADAIEMARDYIGLSGTTFYDKGEEYPMPSSETKAREKVRSRDADSFDFSDGILTYVDIDFDAYRKKIRKSAVQAAAGDRLLMGRGFREKNRLRRESVKRQHVGSN